MKLVERMWLQQRSKYEDVLAWLQSDPPGVPYPKNREALFMMESHLYSQLSAALATTVVANEIYRRGRGGPGPPGPPGQLARLASFPAPTRAQRNVRGTALERNRQSRLLNHRF